MQNEVDHILIKKLPGGRWQASVGRGNAYVIAHHAEPQVAVLMALETQGAVSLWTTADPLRRLGNALDRAIIARTT